MFKGRPVQNEKVFMFYQLNPTIPVRCSRGEGYAVAVIDYSQEHHLLWVVALNPTGEVWCLANPEVTLQVNYSMGRVPAPEKYTASAVRNNLHPPAAEHVNGDRLIAEHVNGERNGA